MAGAKKKKKPAANPARGFATTSLPSKSRTDPTEATDGDAAEPFIKSSGASRAENAPPSSHDAATVRKNDVPKTLSPEQFERQLEESELQLLVEKYAQKVKRDAQRQKARLDTDRRVLRGQAEPINIKKWLPLELMDHILDLIQAESRFSPSGGGSDTGSVSKLLHEEDITIKLWTLEQTLFEAEFPEDKVKAVLQYVLGIAQHVSVGNKESIWGLEEALDWLARECSLDELPDYNRHGKGMLKPQGGTPTDSPLPSGATSPLLFEPEHLRLGGTLKTAVSKPRSPREASPKKSSVAYDSDIEPEDLLPVYIETKEKLFVLQQTSNGSSKGRISKRNPQSQTTAALTGSSEDPEVARLLAKLDRIENDVLFDKFLAEHQWRARQIDLAKEHAAARKKQAEAEKEADAKESNNEPSETRDIKINQEAERMAAEVLAQSDDDDGILADLFSSLPISEVDPDTGKTSTIMSGVDGTRIVIRDFGKWTGVSPVRVLEEACRSRDSATKIRYQLVSDASFANRHSVNIMWSKSQELPSTSDTPNVEVLAIPTQFVFKMISIAAPDPKQSEAFIATTALFHIFAHSPKDEKISLRLPAVWRDIWTELAESKKTQADAEDRAAIKRLRDLIRERREQELEDGVLLHGAFRGRGADKGGEAGEDSNRNPSKHISAGPDYYQRIWQEKSSSPMFLAMLQSRMQLPMWSFRNQVVQAVSSNQVVIICGETGCGKSTQVPSFLLEHQLSQGKPCKIYCTQPRRISAISLARRVSEELGEGRGAVGTPRSLVGYSIRLEANTSRETRLVYATTGIVMRMLEGSNDLQEVTHLVLDEVHERSIDGDFLLIVLRKMLERRRDLKVVLMSATVDAERFSTYLGGAPVLNVPGRTYPVQVKFLEDAVELTGYTVDQQNVEKISELDDDPADSEADGSANVDATKDLKQYSARTKNTLLQIDEYRIEFDLVVQLIGKIAIDHNYSRYSQAVLVFLPGIAEIRQLNDLLLGDKFFSTNWLIYPLHSTIATEDQEAAFLVPPPGYKKIVLATNIAETGITIPDVTCVIDTGKHREMRFDERRQLSRLIDTFISRANAKQRRGRAGRVQEGLCFHLFTKYRHDNLMSDQQTPEMLRLSLQDLAIRVKICKIGGIEETLTGALDPPSVKNIRRAVDALIDVRALTATEELTPLGVQLARLPLDVFLGKLILLGTIFKCLDMAITVAAILSSKTPFAAPFGQRAQADAARLAFRRGDSDILTVYNAYLAWKRVCQSAGGVGQEFQFCRKNFLSQTTLANIEDLKGQLIVSLVDSGFLQLTDEERRNLNRLRYSSGGGARRRHQAIFELPLRVNVNSENDVVAQSVIAWSFYPKLLVRDSPGAKGLRNVGNNQSISLHPTSVNRGHNELRWLSYYHIMQSKAHYNAHETTAVDAFAIALLCGDVRCDMHAGVVVLDGNRARFALPDWKAMMVVKVLRARLKELLTRAFKMPERMPTAQQQRWLEVWQRIFGGQDAGRREGGRSGGVTVKIG